MLEDDVADDAESDEPEEELEPEDSDEPDELDEPDEESADPAAEPEADSDVAPLVEEELFERLSLR